MTGATRASRRSRWRRQVRRLAGWSGTMRQHQAAPRSRARPAHRRRRPGDGDPNGSPRQRHGRAAFYGRHSGRIDGPGRRLAPSLRPVAGVRTAANGDGRMTLRSRFATAVPHYRVPETRPSGPAKRPPCEEHHRGARTDNVRLGSETLLQETRCRQRQQAAPDARQHLVVHLDRLIVRRPARPHKRQARVRVPMREHHVDHLMQTSGRTMTRTGRRGGDRRSARPRAGTMALNRERAHRVSPHLRQIHRIDRLAGHATGLNARFE
jgi:hypothetical protein